MVAALRAELDATLPSLREFFARVQRAAATHSLHPYLDVLVDSIPLECIVHVVASFAVCDASHLLCVPLGMLVQLARWFVCLLALSSMSSFPLCITLHALHFSLALF